MLVRAALLLRDALAERVRGLLPTDAVAYPFAARPQALADAVRHACSLVLCDPAVLGAQPARTLTRLRGSDAHVDVVVLRDADARGDDDAVLAAGCLAVLGTELDDAALADALRSLCGRHRALVRLSLRAPPTDPFAELESAVPAMQQVVYAARRIADSDAPVLLLGETGVGKERLARAIHAASTRADGEFVPVHGAALPEALAESELFGHEAGAFTGAERARRGLFEVAHRGTLFLDEVGELPATVQAKLLRVLQDGEVRPVGAERATRVDVRVVAATHRDLRAEVAAGRFRQDLVYRLNVVTLVIPPLRERLADVPALARRLTTAAAARLGRPVPELSGSALDALVAHAWPGNVRELEHVLERALLLCDGGRIVAADLGLTPRGGSATHVPLDDALVALPWHEARARAIDAFERGYVDRLLRHCGGRIGRAAQHAGLSERALFAAMQRLGLHKEDYRRRGADPAGRRVRGDALPLSSAGDETSGTREPT